MYHLGAAFFVLTLALGTSCKRVESQASKATEQGSSAIQMQYLILNGQYRYVEAMVECSKRKMLLMGGVELDEFKRFAQGKSAIRWERAKRDPDSIDSRTETSFHGLWHVATFPFDVKYLHAWQNVARKKELPVYMKFRLFGFGRGGGSNFAYDSMLLSNLPEVSSAGGEHAAVNNFGINRAIMFNADHGEFIGDSEPDLIANKAQAVCFSNLNWDFAKDDPIVKDSPPPEHWDRTDESWDRTGYLWAFTATKNGTLTEEWHTTSPQDTYVCQASAEMFVGEKKQQIKVSQLRVIPPMPTNLDSDRESQWTTKLNSDRTSECNSVLSERSPWQDNLSCNNVDVCKDCRSILTGATLRCPTR